MIFSPSGISVALYIPHHALSAYVPFLLLYVDRSAFSGLRSHFSGLCAKAGTILWKYFSSSSISWPSAHHLATTLPFRPLHLQLFSMLRGRRRSRSPYFLRYLCFLFKSMFISPTNHKQHPDRSGILPKGLSPWKPTSGLITDLTLTSSNFGHGTATNPKNPVASDRMHDTTMIKWRHGSGEFEILPWWAGFPNNAPDHTYLRIRGACLDIPLGVLVWHRASCTSDLNRSRPDWFFVFFLRVKLMEDFIRIHFLCWSCLANVGINFFISGVDTTLRQLTSLAFLLVKVVASV